MRVPRFVLAPVGLLAAGYIAAMRRRFSSRSAAPGPHLRRILEPYFASTTLDSVRLCVLGDEQIPDPFFYPLLSRLGFRDLPSFRTVAAVTFQNVIVGQEEFTPRLLFHELVHAVQYRQLGLRLFSQLYVLGFVRGGGYEGIPLEQHAYLLDSRFCMAPQRYFSVEAEVQSWISAGKY